MRGLGYRNGGCRHGLLHQWVHVFPSYKHFFSEVSFVRVDDIQYDFHYDEEHYEHPILPVVQEQLSQLQVGVPIGVHRAWIPWIQHFDTWLRICKWVSRFDNTYSGSILWEDYAVACERKNKNNPRISEYLQAVTHMELSKCAKVNTVERLEDLDSRHPTEIKKSTNILWKCTDHNGRLGGENILKN